MTPSDAIALARKRSAKLLAVVGEHLPIDVATTGRHDDWGVTGPAFVARAARLLIGMMLLPDEHEASAGVLARVLYEHVVIFTWLAIDPPTNLPIWVRKDREERLKIDTDMKGFGQPLLAVSARARFESEIAAVPQSWPGLPTMAEQADKHWSQRASEFTTSLYGLRGMYVVAYRPLSGLVHGMTESLARIVDDGPRAGVSRVGVEVPPTEYNAFTSAPFVFALALVASGDANGFPRRDDVVASF